ncbi:clathrin heavy chain linker domain-containing protein 1 [Falco rusticolus]|uniref:clathrin heavy chain linker domain-containing protein 1 n=1 Tax=Falco rusticolus TaxID=120794 RepID=UPI0018865501|nr:clathrin heavy chain linker domain-containing protein 1 [Falco rusticolus]
MARAAAGRPRVRPRSDGSAATCSQNGGSPKGRRAAPHGTLCKKGARLLCHAITLEQRKTDFHPAIFEKDRSFLGILQAYILTETEKVDCAEQGPSEECYIIYRNAFGKEKGISRLIESCWHCYRNQGWVYFLLVLCPFAAEWSPLQLKDTFLGAQPMTFVSIPLVVSCLKELINSSTAAGHLPSSAITLEAIKCALSGKGLNLVNTFTFSEAVEDIIYNYRKVEPSNESKCLALAQVAYDALGQIILLDTICTLEDWNKIAVSCAENKHEKLSEKIVLILTYQDGVFEDLPLEGEKGARIMEHVFR